MKTEGVVQFVGWSGSGKTTLIERVLEELETRGLRAATVKHAGGFDELDRPGKDSFRFRRAGARASVLVSRKKTALFVDHDEQELSWEKALELARVLPVDLVLVESFGAAPLPKLEVYRSEVGRGRLRAVGDPLLRAVITDDAVDGYRGELVPPGQIGRVTDMVVEIARGIWPPS